MKAKIKKLIRKLKYKFSKKELVFCKSIFGIDDKLILDRNVAISIAYYDHNKNMYVVILKHLDIMEV